MKYLTLCALIFMMVLMVSMVSADSVHRRDYHRRHHKKRRTSSYTKKVTTTKKVHTTTSKTKSSTLAAAKPTTTKKSATTKSKSTTKPAATKSVTTTKTTTSNKTTTTKKASITTSSPAPTTPAGSGSGTTYTGDGTWFNQGLGSCGETSTDDELVAALNAPQMNNGANPNNNPMCGKQIKVTNPANGNSVTVKIVDTCPPCSSGSVDLSPSAFAKLASLDAGRIKISWDFL